jgi:bacteriorhodopsin
VILVQLIKLGINNWIFLGLSVIAALLFLVMYFSSRSTANLLPTLNMLISAALILKWFSFLSITPQYNSAAIFAEATLSMSLIYLQTLALASTSLKYWLALVVLEGFEMICIYAYTIAYSGFDWVWFALALVFWLAIVGILLGPVNKIMRTKSGRVYSLFNSAIWIIILLEGFYLVNFVLYRTGTYSLLWFFILLGVMDMIMHVGLGLLFASNWDAFDAITIFEPRNLERVQQEVVTGIQNIV